MLDDSDLIFQEASHESDEGEKEDEEPAGVTENTYTKKNVEKKSAPIIRKMKNPRKKVWLNVYLSLFW